MRLYIKEFASLADEATLAKLRSALPAPCFVYDRAYIRERLWRCIEVSGTAEGLRIGLSNVDEECAHTGHCRVATDLVKHRIVWDDLNDVDGIRQALVKEPAVVSQQVLELLGRLRGRALSLRHAMAEI